MSVDLPPDVVLPFHVVTDAAFPWGLRCAHDDCDRPIDVGQPYTEHVTRIHTNGDTIAHLACVYCPCDEAMEACL